MRSLAVAHLSATLVFTTMIMAVASPAVAQLSDYTLFESDPVRPLAMSPDGSRIFVVNTPDGYLEKPVDPSALLAMVKKFV